MTQVITPTVGRKVWYRPCANDLLGPVPMQVCGSIEAGNIQPLDATIIAVWGERMINVLVTDIVGRQFAVMSCGLVQPGEDVAEDGRYCEWMPYQVATSKPAVASPSGESGGRGVSHATDVLYPAISLAMAELESLPQGFNEHVDRAFNLLHGAFWSETPAPASAAPLREVGKRPALH